MRELKSRCVILESSQLNRELARTYRIFRLLKGIFALSKNELFAMKKINYALAICTGLILTCISISGASGQELSSVQDPNDKVALFHQTRLLHVQDSLEKRYLNFFDNDHMMMGIYTLKKGSEDKQSPHEIDEAYYVLEGRAKFEVEDRDMSVAPGDILFVKADAVHKFYDIEEDLRLLVFFAKHQ